MLDAIEAPHLLAAIEAWQPDPQCIAAGDEYFHLAIRCWAGSLCDAQIIRRILDLAGISASVDTPERWSAAWAIARDCALMDVPLHRIIALLAHLAAEVPCWPNADDIAEIAEAAVAECAA
jgi:hypothetical protein